MGLLTSIGTAFFLGLITPLTAVCVLPLYPGFLSYLANQVKHKDDKKQILKFGLLVSLGVISFMILLGLIFTTVLEVSLTNVIGILSPIAFILLMVISIFLIFDTEIGSIFPKLNIPTSSNPNKSAFIYGFFFGSIILPCNPLIIAAFFARSSTITSFGENILSFFMFGIGIATPLLLLSIISLTHSRGIINILLKYKRSINIISGILMLVISSYYLVFVFKIFG